LNGKRFYDVETTENNAMEVLAIQKLISRVSSSTDRNCRAITYRLTELM
jgi:hypothetical protein